MTLKYHHFFFLIIILSGVILYPLGEALGQSPEANTTEKHYLQGMKYYSGKGVEKDPVEAVKWLRNAASEGHIKAQYNLGVIYSKGDGVDKDVKEAANWFYLAAEQDFPKAQYYLGLLYGNGHGLPQSYSEAAKWTVKAANHLKMHGHYRKAILWCQRAAEEGDLFALSTLGDYYRQGNGVTIDFAEAAGWYRKTAKQYKKQGNHKEAVRFNQKAKELEDEISLLKDVPSEEEPVEALPEKPVEEDTGAAADEPVDVPAEKPVEDPLTESADKNLSGEKVKLLSELERDQISYLSKEILINGVIQLDDYYDFGYTDAENTHYSFKLIDNKYSYAYLYGSMDWTESAELKNIIIQEGPQTGIFNFIIYRSRYAESSAVIAELVGYHLNSE